MLKRSLFAAAIVATSLVGYAPAEAATLQVSTTESNFIFGDSSLTFNNFFQEPTEFVEKKKFEIGQLTFNNQDPNAETTAKLTLKLTFKYASTEEGSQSFTTEEGSQSFTTEEGSQSFTINVYQKSENQSKLALIDFNQELKTQNYKTTFYLNKINQRDRVTSQQPPISVKRDGQKSLSLRAKVVTLSF